MTVRITKPEFNLREKISELDKPVGLKGSELMRTDTVQEARDLIGAGRKNLVINGSFIVDQRLEGSELSITSNNKFSADRWTHNNDRFTHYKTQRKLDADIATIGTSAYLRATITAVDNNLGANQSHMIENNLEGYTVSHLNLGTLGAKQCTLSFWVRCSLTGLFGGSLQNANYDRCHPFSYTIDTADTWEYKTFTFNTYGFTTGSFQTGNGVGLRLAFSLGQGTNRQGSPDRWHAGNKFSPTGETILVHNNGATLDIAQVQLEVGNTATEFEHRSYGEELELCQRYYYSIYRRGSSNEGNLSIGGVGSLYTNSNVYIDLLFPTQMRASPTLIVASGTNRFQVCPTTCIPFGNPTLIHAHKNAATLTATLTSSNTAGRVGNVFMQTSNWSEGDQLAFMAEL